ncbi:MAG: YdbL family protein [Gammaproteobacteria bacterium]|nr:YdbL family protein [Gammaproteobacteria bacterium]
MMRQDWLKTQGWRSVLVLGLLMALSACVTVNIYFPAAAAQKLADQVVGEVYKAAAKGALLAPVAPAVSVPAPPAAPTRSAAPASNALSMASPYHAASYLLAMGFSAISGTAEAAANLDASSPGVQSARAQLEAIAAQMRPYFVSGAVGFTANGLVAIHDAAAVPLQQRAALNGLVNSNNSALSNLYQQIADANGHPEWAGQIQQTFAQAWINKAPAGYWYQSPSGQWQKK